jgi:hypothetical protein
MIKIIGVEFNDPYEMIIRYRRDDGWIKAHIFSGSSATSALKHIEDTLNEALVTEQGIKKNQEPPDPR